MNASVARYGKIALSHKRNLSTLMSSSRAREVVDEEEDKSQHA